MNSLAGKTILLTGGTGFIGTHLLNRLKETPNVRLLSLSRKPIAQTEPNVTWITSALDQLNRRTWSDLRVGKIDVVFHLGAFTPKAGREADSVSAIYQDNILGTRALLESLSETPEKIVFSSTLDVYGPMADGEVLTESSALDPAALYGASKLFCEHLVKAYARVCGCGYAILRYGHIYGPGEAAYAKLIPQAIRALLRNESPLVYGDGSVQRDFLYVGDAVEATVRAAEANAEKIDPVNVVRGESRPIREFVDMLAGMAGFDGKVKYLLEKSGGQSLRFCNDRMFEKLGHWALVPLETGLQREIDYFRTLA